ncbi:MAG TPA: 2Fe-2S iron-sulfur cluster-binding protein [Candidatus Limnocylindria bacterium]|nr:2Fe-2S iron-sulfur cluster-binding protein [Candidatus Limnocylindria bacterium]
MSLHRIRFTLNGAAVDVTVPADRLLVDLLRDDLRSTGTKDGCSVGVCGLCTVQVDGAPLSACLLLATQVDGTAIRTIEGLATPLQEAFISEGGFQCGICTSGQLMTADALLRAKPDATDAEIADWQMGNLCRCTGYYGIARAIAKVRDA